MTDKDITAALGRVWGMQSHNLRKLITAGVLAAGVSLGQSALASATSAPQVPVIVWHRDAEACRTIQAYIQPGGQCTQLIYLIAQFVTQAGTDMRFSVTYTQAGQRITRTVYSGAITDSLGKRTAVGLLTDVDGASEITASAVELVGVAAGEGRAQ